jgi:hypothetical protein
MLNDDQGEGISATGLSHRMAWRSDRRVLPTRIIDSNSRRAIKPSHYRALRMAFS